VTEKKLDFLYILTRERFGFLTCYLHSKSDTFSKYINLTIEDIEDLLKTFEINWNEEDYQSSFCQLIQLLRKGKVISEITDELLVLIELYYKNTFGYGKKVSFEVLLSWNDFFYEKYIDQILIDEANDFDYCLSLLHQYETNISRIEKYLLIIQSVEIRRSKTCQKLIKKYHYLQNKED
jgi:hypothetical protein